MCTPSSPVFVILATSEGQGEPRSVILKTDCAKGTLHSGGSSLNLTCIYEAKDNNSITNEQLRACKDKVLELFNALENSRRAHACTLKSAIHCCV